jgi:hypothetical protein
MKVPPAPAFADARAIVRQARRVYAPDYVPPCPVAPRSPRLDTPAARPVRSARRAALARSVPHLRLLP